MNSNPWTCDAGEEGPIDFSVKTTVSSSPPTNNRQSPVTESDASTDEMNRSVEQPKSNGYKWKKAKTTSSASASPAAATAAAAAALAAYNLTTPSPSPPDATSSTSMSLLSSLQNGSTTTSDVLARLLQYGSGQVGHGSAGKLTSLPGLREGLHHQPMDTSSTSENDDMSMSPHHMDVSGKASSSSRKKGRPLPEELKDDAYWERRRKNNEAAKRSRDARRAKEYEVAIRATILEQENLKLRVEIASLKTELAKLRCLMYPSMQQQSNQSNGNRKSRECCRHDHD